MNDGDPRAASFAPAKGHGDAQIWLNLWLLLSVLGVGLVIVWGAARSFDFTDEGAYYLSAVHPEEVPDRQTIYFRFGRVLFGLAGHNIIATRTLIAGLVLAATLIFSRGLRRFLGAFAPVLDPGGWFGIAAIAGSTLSFSISPVAPSYNLLNAICLLAITGLALESSAAGPTHGSFPRLAAVMPLFFSGALLAADFLIKFSTSALLGLSLTLFFFLISRKKIQRKAALALAIAILGALLAGGFFLCVEHFPAWHQGIAGTWNALTGGTYLQAVLLRYANELQAQGLETLWSYESVFTVLFGAGAVLLVFRRKPRIQRWLALAGAVAAVGIGVQAGPADLFLQGGEVAGRFYLAVIGALALAGVLTVLVRNPAHRPALSGALRPALALLGLLALLPFIGAFGTSNNINENAIYQLAPWLALIAILLAWLAQAWQARWLLAPGVLFISAVSFSQFVHGYVFDPYRIPGGRPAQTAPTSVGYPATILHLDPASHDFVEEVRAQLVSHGFKPGDDVFAFFNLPGMVFAVGGVSPGHPWYFAGTENSLVLDTMRVQNVASARRQAAFIVQNGELADFPSRLRALGIDFPAAYVLCGPALRNPLTGEIVEVWKSKSR